MAQNQERRVEMKKISRTTSSGVPTSTVSINDSEKKRHPGNRSLMATQMKEETIQMISKVTHQKIILTIVLFK